MHVPCGIRQGLHFPERARPPPGCLDKRQGCMASTSFHDLDTLDLDWTAFDYAFLSPIFDSLSKEGYRAVQLDSARLRARLGRPIPPRLVALGGITAARVPQVHTMGFEGVAVIGAVWDAADPVAACSELQRACAACWGEV
jgi:thiamine-phosphate pyrophosphorylase